MRRGRIKKKDNRKAFLFLMPSLAGVTVFVLIPFFDVIRRSFYEAMGKKAVGLSNYKLVMENEAFKQAVSNTVRFLAVCIPVLMIVSLVIVLLIQGIGEQGEQFKTVFLVPLAIPIASVVLLWDLVFDNAGYLNLIMDLLHLERVDWMNGETVFPVLVFSYLWKNTGYNMVLWLAGLNGISLSLYEAAKVDGAGTWKCFWYITLPNLKSTVFIIGVLSFVNSFKVFREAYLVAGDYPNESIYMLQHLFNNWFVSMDIHKMSAAAVMTSVFIILLLIFVQWINDKGERA